MFSVIIKGKTIKELRENIATLEKSFYSGDIQPVPAEPEVQEDFLTQAAAEPRPAAIPFEPVFESTGPTDLSNVDSKGMPWDERIHASSRAVNKDGSWRTKRGVENYQIVRVEQELIAKKKGAHVEQPSFVPPVPAPPVTPPPIPKPEPALPSAHSAETFKRNLIPTLAKLVKEGKLTHEYVNQLKQHFNVDEIHQVTESQAEEMFNMFAHYGMIAKV